MAALAMLPVIGVVLSMIVGSLAAIGRIATPAAERAPLRRWRLREVAANASIGRREWALALDTAYRHNPSSTAG